MKKRIFALLLAAMLPLGAAIADDNLPFESTRCHSHSSFRHVYSVHIGMISVPTL